MDCGHLWSECTMELTLALKYTSDCGMSMHEKTLILIDLFIRSNHVFVELVWSEHHCFESLPFRIGRDHRPSSHQIHEIGAFDVSSIHQSTTRKPWTSRAIDDRSASIRL